jgi:RNA polymerase sigma-70 factor (ECF subfamily)
MLNEDADLVAEAQQGNLSAFNLIVDRYQARVYNLSARILGDRTAAEDIAQETFISAYRAMGRFRGGSLRAWLFRIASNLSYDHLRSARRRPADSLDEQMLKPGFSVPSPEASPEQMAVRAELRGAIQQAIMSLPADQRATIVMVDVQGLSYEEAAEATGVSIGTVKSRMSRARSRVRDSLLKEGELLPAQFRRAV